MPIIITRTYETFAIKFDGSEWSSYRTRAEAEAGARFSTRPYEITRRTFEVSFEKDSILRPLECNPSALF